MATVPSLTSTVQFEAPEDAMEVYPGADPDPAEEDGIDIDLDLATDHNENTYDEEMIEDFDPDVEDTNSTVGEVQDEGMMIDEEEDEASALKAANEVYSEDHQELDKNPGISDYSESAFGTAERAAQASESNPINLPSESQLQDLPDQDHLVEQSQHDQSNYPDSTPNDTQSGTHKSPAHKALIAKDLATASPAISLARPITAVLEDDEFTDHDNHRPYDAQNLSEGPSSGTHIPLIFAEEQQIKPSHNPSDSSRSVAETTKEKAMDATTVVEQSRHESNSPRNSDNVQNTFPELSAIKVENASTPNSQDNCTLAGTDLSQATRGNPNEPKVPEMGSFEEDEEDAVPDDLHMHPVTVRYQDREMYLFPPTKEQKDHDKYFLSDETLAAEEIRSLFQGFRDYLGESISNVEELTIKFDDLDLWISESNNDTHNISLAHILDIYRELHHNESDEPPKAMHLTLLTNTRFTGSLEHLARLATEGIGLSQIGYDGHLSPEDDLFENQQTLDGSGPLETPCESADSASASGSKLTTDGVQSKPLDKHTMTESSATESTKTNGFLNKSAEDVLENALPLLERTNPGNATDVAVTITKAVVTSNSKYAADPSVLQDLKTSTTTSAPRASDTANRDLNGEEYYEDEEGYDVATSAHPNDEESAGSSTVQGDDAEIAKNDQQLSNVMNLPDGRLANAQQQVPSQINERLEPEDIISYETDEEGYADDVVDVENIEGADEDLQWQDNDGGDIPSSEFEEPRPYNSNDISRHVQTSAHPAEDEDEITFDEEESKDSSNAIPDPDPQPPSRSSPTLLKRDRDIDEGTEIDIGQSRSRPRRMVKSTRTANFFGSQRHKKGPFRMSQSNLLQMNNASLTPQHIPSMILNMVKSWYHSIIPRSQAAKMDNFVAAIANRPRPSWRMVD
ncbi:MAG: hypothetical protein Q9176_007610 [Flavoplaca citrina]